MQCEGCKAWEHVACYYTKQPTEEDRHSCATCTLNAQQRELHRQFKKQMERANVLEKKGEERARTMDSILVAVERLSLPPGPAPAPAAASPKAKADALRPASTSSMAHATKKLDRAARTTATLTESNGAVLDMRPGELEAVLRLVHATTDQVTHARANDTVDSTARDIARALASVRAGALPEHGIAPAELFPLDLYESKGADELLRGVLFDRSKKRAFADYSEMDRVLQPHLDGLMESDPAMFKHWYKYQLWVVKQRELQPWTFVSMYHFNLFDKIKQGQFRLEDGPFHAETYKETELQHAKKGSKNGASQKGPRVLCSYHGWVDHATAKCTVLAADPSKKGSRAPNFREK